MRENLLVVKVGGNILDDEEKLRVFLQSFHRISGNKVLVHGGGKIATMIADQMGYKTKMIEGRRITDEAMLRIVTMTYGGLLNKKLASELIALGTQAVGISGLDGKLIKAHKRPKQNGIDFGLVGDVDEVDTGLIEALINNGFTPVIAPLTNDDQGQILNTNADTMANEIAVGLTSSYQVNLIYAFELPGVMADILDPQSLIRKIDKQNFGQLKKDKKVQDGMIPKLDNAFQAISNGVSKVSIAHFASIGQLADEDFHEYTVIQ